MNAAYARSQTSSKSHLPVVVLGLIVLAAAWWVLVRDTKSEVHLPATITLPSSFGSSKPDPPKGEAGAASGTVRPLETSKVFASKDPFEPLIDAGATSVVTDDTGATVRTGGRGAAQTSAKSATAAPAPDDVTGTTLSVVKVTQSEAVNVSVEGKVFRVVRGERFAKSFKLVLVDGKCASMLYGDDQFSLCEGEEVSK